MSVNYRRAIFPGRGRQVIATICGYELVALIPRSPLPPISDLVRRWPVVGAVLLLALTHHWYVESA